MGQVELSSEMMHSKIHNHNFNACVLMVDGVGAWRRCWDGKEAANMVGFGNKR